MKSFYVFLGRQQVGTGWHVSTIFESWWNWPSPSIFSTTLTKIVGTCMYDFIAYNKADSMKSNSKTVETTVSWIKTVGKCIITPQIIWLSNFSGDLLWRPDPSLLGFSIYTWNRWRSNPPPYFWRRSPYFLTLSWCLDKEGINSEWNQSRRNSCSSLLCHRQSYRIKLKTVKWSEHVFQKQLKL